MGGRGHVVFKFTHEIERLGGTARRRQDETSMPLGLAGSRENMEAICENELILLRQLHMADSAG